MGIIILILQGKYSHGELVSHATSRRMVSIALDNKKEVSDVRKFACNDGQIRWGIGNEEGWWLIDEAFECMEPTQELHEGKHPVSFALTPEQFNEIMEGING